MLGYGILIYKAVLGHARYLCGGTFIIEVCSVPCAMSCASCVTRMQIFVCAHKMQTTENWNNVISLSVRPYVEQYVSSANPTASGILLNTYFTTQILFVACILFDVIMLVSGTCAHACFGVMVTHLCTRMWSH